MEKPVQNILFVIDHVGRKTLQVRHPMPLNAPRGTAGLRYYGHVSGSEKDIVGLGLCREDEIVLPVRHNGGSQFTLATPAAG